MPTKLSNFTIRIGLLYQLTKMYMPIYLVRLDQRTNEVVILASEEIEISIKPNGQWAEETSNLTFKQ